MHPRSPYATRRPDFAALARADAAFARLVRLDPRGEAHLNWSDPTALAELCRVLLLHDFGVRWTLPARALCPTVPSRLNYLLWMDDLLALAPAPPEATIIGIDIGTWPMGGVIGCRAIVPLALGQWSIGTLSIGNWDTDK